MSAVASEYFSRIVAPVCPFKPRDRVRLIPDALKGMCRKARETLDGEATIVSVGGVRGHDPNTVDVLFDGFEFSEWWDVSMLEHVGSDVTDAALSKGAETP